MRRLILVLLAALALAPAPATAAGDDRFEALRALDARVGAIAFRLSVANSGRCAGATALQDGLVLHSIEQYGGADREAAASAYRLGAHIGVMAVVPGSPADAAGLSADDQLVSANGRALRASGDGSGAEPRGFVTAAERILADEYAQGAVTIGVLRDGHPFDLRLVPRPGCAARIEMLPGRGVNAWANGERIMVSAGLALRATSDDALAMVIGHEMAHNLLGHRLHGHRRARFEEEADRLGFALALAAGYDGGRAMAGLAGLVRDAKRTRRLASFIPG